MKNFLLSCRMYFEVDRCLMTFNMNFSDFCFEFLLCISIYLCVFMTYITETSKNMVKYDPLKRMFLGRFSYVETGLSTNLRSEWVLIALINIHAKFQLIMTTGTSIYPRFLIFGMSSMKEPGWHPILPTFHNHHSTKFRIPHTENFPMHRCSYPPRVKCMWWLWMHVWP